MAHLSDRNADRCSARHGRAIMRAYLQQAYGRAISSHTVRVLQSHMSLRSCGLRLLLVRNGTTRNPEQRTELDSGSAPKRAHPGMTRTYRRAEFRTHRPQNDTNGQPGALTPWHRVW